MRLRWIRRYRAEKEPARTSGGSPLIGGRGTPTLKSSLTLQEQLKVKENGKTVYRWEDVEVFEDLETKEKAIEELRKEGVYVPLRVKS